MLQFDEEKHAYSWNGKPVPGVTSLLKHLHSFEGIPASVLEAACERGTAVHLATEYFDLGILDEESIDSAIAGYVDAWRRFRAENDTVWSHVEAQCYHPLLRYAGTVDRVGTLNGDQWVLDIKTAVASHPVWGVQTAAYSNALQMPTARRGTVQLRKDGTYRLVEWKGATDFSVFVSLITINNFVESNK
jgi:hypothetical protein